MEPIVVTDTQKRRVTIRLASDELVVTETHYAADERGPDLHVHHLHADSFHVLEGEMSFWLDGRELHAEAGDWVHVPPGAVHTFAFPGSDDVRFLNVHTPSCGFGDFLRALHNAHDENELVAARAAFDQEPAA